MHAQITALLVRQNTHYMHYYVNENKTANNVHYPLS